jgi:hypothetical protein
LPAFSLTEGRINGPQQKRTRQVNAFEPLADDPFLERRHINDDIRKFRHGSQGSIFATLLSHVEDAGLGRLRNNALRLGPSIQRPGKCNPSCQ